MGALGGGPEPAIRAFAQVPEEGQNELQVHLIRIRLALVLAQHGCPCHACRSLLHLLQHAAAWARWWASCWPAALVVEEGRVQVGLSVRNCPEWGQHQRGCASELLVMAGLVPGVCPRVQWADCVQAGSLLTAPTLPNTGFMLGQRHMRGWYRCPGQARPPCNGEPTMGPCLDCPAAPDTGTSAGRTPRWVLMAWATAGKPILEAHWAAELPSLDAKVASAPLASSVSTSDKRPLPAATMSGVAPAQTHPGLRTQQPRPGA